MNTKDLSLRIKQFVDRSIEVLATKRHSDYGDPYVDSAKVAGLRASVLSFIAMVYGKNHSHYLEYNTATVGNFERDAKRAYEIILAIQDEIDGGWIFSMKQLVSAEIFSDFLEMAEHLLEQDYKDPAAVMIGSVLEENLRQLCRKNDIDTEIEKKGSLKPKKADRLNADLAKEEIYTKLDQKSVTMWLDLRNKAAHGMYAEYSKEQVQLMLNSVIEFLARINL